MVARGIRHAVITVLLTVTVLHGAAPASIADDGSSFRDLATGSDFRIRVAAAMTLGKSKETGARSALEKALGDAHPAVRAAAAAGLGALGDAAAVPALKAALAKETTATVQAQFQTTIARLSGSGAPATKAKFLISLGKVENKSGVSGSELVPALKSATRAKMALVPGVELLAEGTDISAASKSRGLPGFTVDGTLVQLAKKQNSTDVGYAARVEYVVRKMPEQLLKGSIGGNAQALADAKQVRGQTELAQLQIDAMSAAVESALKGLEAATK